MNLNPALSYTPPSFPTQCDKQYVHYTSYVTTEKDLTSTFSELTITGSYLQRLGAKLGFTKENRHTVIIFSRPLVNSELEKMFSITSISW